MSDIQQSFLTRRLNVLSIDSSHLCALVFLSTFAAALVAHAFCWTNSLFGHDSLLLVQTDLVNQVAMGRPFQYAYLYLRGYVAAPWLIGLAGTLFIAFANMMICKLLGIVSRGGVICLCCIMATSPVVTLTCATYINYFDTYMLSFMFATLSVYLCSTYKHGWLLGILCICVSMGLYPAYIQVTIVLIGGLFLTVLLRNMRKLQGMFVMKSILMVAIGVVLYFICVWAIQNYSGIHATTGYNSPSAAFQFRGSLLHELGEAWLAPLSYLLFPETHMVRVSALCNAALILIFAIAVVKCIVENRLRPRTILVVLFIIAFIPLASNLIGFASGNNNHALTILSFFLFYPITLSCLDISRRPHADSSSGQLNCLVVKRAGVFFNALFFIAAALLIFISVSNAIYANQVYLKKDLEYQSTLSIMTRLEEKLEMIPEYVPGKTIVAFSGNLSDNSFFSDVRQGFPPSSDQPSFADEEGHYTKYSLGLGADVSLYDFVQMNRYYEYILGCPIHMASVEGLSESKKAPLESMSVFPLDGSIVYHEGIVLVKLSS